MRMADEGLFFCRTPVTAFLGDVTLNVEQSPTKHLVLNSENERRYSLVFNRAK